MTSFPAYVVQKDAQQTVSAAVQKLQFDDLPQGEVLLRVAWSSLNYKDALAATGHPGVARSLPHVPGIDAAGTVWESGDARFQKGDKVLVTGYELGAGRWGGFAAYARVPADWVVPLPEGLSLRESMIYGTAGFTAALSLAALEEHGVAPGAGQVVVTGASGGVGSLAVALLAKQGYQVVAVTGKEAAHELLRELGAVGIVGRDAVDDSSDRPLLKARWAGAVDTVGGNTLATLLRSTHRAGCVAACGLVGGAALQLTVYPFILRGVTLVGIDSAECPMDRRQELWQRLAGPWKPPGLDRLAREIGLEDLPAAVAQILAGQVTGRVLVKPLGWRTGIH